MSADPQGQPLAAVDLGSNSFHLVVARAVNGRLDMMDRLRERVSLASGLTRRGDLTEEAQERALGCLARFGERIQGIPEGGVRAVGTNTLRKAHNSAEFLDKAQGVLGHPIEVVSGDEEARLIYLGVSHSVAEAPGRRLVVDIGGGSTECILGERFQPMMTDSLHMGCINWSQRFFEKELKKEGFKEAETAAQLELLAIRKSYRKLGWTDAIGSSGTIRAVAEILAANGWSEHGITPRGLVKLRKAVVAAGKVKNLSLPGLQADRRSVLPGGLAILLAVFRSLGIDRMVPSQGALREGLLYDLLGRIRHEDVRDRTISSFQERFHVDLKQAARVESVARRILDQTYEAWKLPLELSHAFLAWAARLHEIGISLSYSGYQRHGAYLIENADMPGFSRPDKRLLALLVRNHRRKFARETLEGLPPQYAEFALRLCVILRLACCLTRSRTTSKYPPELEVQCESDGLRLRFKEGWLAAHPLVAADLLQEAQYLAPMGMRQETG